MKKIILLATTLIIAHSSIYAQTAPGVHWKKNYGGSSSDEFRHVIQAPNGKYYYAGSTSSSDEDLSGNFGLLDMWLSSTSTAGVLGGSNNIGGSESDYGQRVIGTSDGSFVVAGSSYSSDIEDVLLRGEKDFFVTKVDADMFTTQWSKMYGGPGTETLTDAIQTQDLGYILCGTTTASGGFVAGHRGSNDAYIVKVDSYGNFQWSLCIGGTQVDNGVSIRQTSDGGYIVGCVSNSTDGDFNTSKGEQDIWLVKISHEGTIIWKKNYGGSKNEYLASVLPTSDNGFIIFGDSESNDGDLGAGGAGEYDLWLVKTNNLGTIQWHKRFGGSLNEYANAIDIATDGYILAGQSKSNDGDVTGGKGNFDGWIVKTDLSGNLKWQKTAGGTEEDVFYSIKQSADKGYIAVGYSYSSSGDVPANKGDRDAWVFKLKPETATSIQDEQLLTQMKVYPNPLEHERILVIESKTEEILYLIDITGELIKTIDIQEGMNNVPLKDLAPGMYILSNTSGASMQLVVK